MAELEPWMAAQGIFLDANGIPTLPDGTPALPQNRPPSDIPRGDTSAPILQAMAQQVHEGNLALERGEPPPQELQTVGGFQFPQDPVGYSLGPFYGASSQDYRDSGRGPALDPPQWNMGLDPEEQPGALNFGDDQGVLPMNWKDYYTPNDRSTGGGYFMLRDAFGPGQTPWSLGGEGLPQELGPTAGLPSTNNWRLLPGDYRSPRFLMRNGIIIDRGATDLRGPPIPDIGFGNNYGGPLWNLGVGAAYGVPAGRSAGYTQAFGWPGGLGGWLSGTYWNG